MSHRGILQKYKITTLIFAQQSKSSTQYIAEINSFSFFSILSIFFFLPDLGWCFLIKPVLVCSKNAAEKVEIFSSHQTGPRSVAQPPTSQLWLCATALPSSWGSTQQQCLGYALDIELVLLHSSVPATPLNFPWVFENNIIYIHTHTHIKQSSQEFVSGEEANIDFFKL